jgi:hypothetical protein
MMHLGLDIGYHYRSFIGDEVDIVNLRCLMIETFKYGNDASIYVEAKHYPSMIDFKIIYSLHGCHTCGFIL